VNKVWIPAFAGMTNNKNLRLSALILSNFKKKAPGARREREKRDLASLQVLVNCSVVLEPSHPYRPVIGTDATGFGPAACCIKRTMPLECP
jgi:hypothetical protein